MSIEIKFRAWGRTLESDTPTMTEPFDFRKYVMYHEGAQARMLPTVGDDVVYMQYTGLKDKNGVEIYEGDVVEHGSRDELDFGVGTVERNKEWACFELKCSYDWGDTHTSNEVIAASREWRVIGNIYENPELLKGGEQ